MKKTICVLAAAAAGLAGCASAPSVPIPEASLSELNGQTVTYITRERPAFSALTPGKAMFGALGAIAMVTEGKKIVEENNVADPADDISAELLAGLQTRFSAKGAEKPIHIVAATKDVTPMAGGSRYVLDVQTLSWMMSYQSTKWNTYSVLYNGQARLIDLQTKKVVAGGVCHADTAKLFPETMKSHAEMVDNQAAGLKAALAKINDYCLGKYKTEIFKL